MYWWAPSSGSQFAVSYYDCAHAGKDPCRSGDVQDEPGLLRQNLGPAGSTSSPVQPTPVSTSSGGSSLVKTDSGAFVAFGLGTDNALWHNWQLAPGGNWYGWVSLGGSLKAL